MIVNCVSLSKGIAVGKAFWYHDILTRDLSFYSISSKDIAYETKRINNSITDVKKDLYKLGRTISRNISSHEGSIFDAQRMMLEDEDFLYEFEKEVHVELINAEQATKNVFRKFINRFRDSKNEVIKAKAEDLQDILRKVLRSLLGIETSVLEKLPKNSIVISRRLLPSDTIRLDRKNVCGIVVQEGSVHSHSAMLARSLSIPAISSEGNPLDFIKQGEDIIVDGLNSILIHLPDPQTHKKYYGLKKSISEKRLTAQRIRRAPAHTKNGRPIRFYANINNHSDIQQAVSSGCDGIGLLRIEGIYLESRTMPSEEHLYDKLYRSIADFDRKTVTIRLLDIGGDKRLPYFAIGDEISPFLGLRGIRLLLRHSELLMTQLKVIVRLRQEFNIRLLIPMVTVLKEIIEVKTIIKECLKKAEEETGKKMKDFAVGAMIETPAAALKVSDILRHSDFISIGTNDLIQYIMAAGRENPEVANYYEYGNEIVMPVIEDILKNAKKQNKECSICGEMANDKNNLEKFIKMGLNIFSVSPHSIPELKEYVSNIE